MIDNLSIAVHAFAMRTLTSLSVDEILLPRSVIILEAFHGSLSFKTRVLRFICVHMVEAGLFTRSARSSA